MSIEAITWVLRKSKATLGARLVLLSLADHAHPDGSSAFPSVSTIGRQALLSERQVQRCLRELEELGEITRTGTTKLGVQVWGVNLSPDFVNDGSENKGLTTPQMSPLRDNLSGGDNLSPPAISAVPPGDPDPCVVCDQPGVSFGDGQWWCATHAEDYFRENVMDDLREAK